MPLRRLLVAGSALLALTLTPAAAQAASVISSVTATPSSTQAGAHADLGIAMAFGPSEEVRNLTIHLPRGFVGNPQATPICSQAQFAVDACPAASQVGTTVVTATVTMSIAPPQSETVSGQVFNLEPLAGEPARLGVLLPSAAALGGLVTTQPVRMQSIVSVRTATDYGLDSILANLPRTIETNLGTATSHIDRITLSLRGRVPGATLPFLTNPTTCVPARTAVDVTSYAGTTDSAASSYTPTACDRLEYSPTISASLDGAGTNQHPQLTTVVSQDADEATSKTVVVRLPAGIGSNLAALNIQCPSASFDAGTCPVNTQVGNATAVTPLLAAPLSGPVFLVATPGGGLPGLGISLNGLLPVKLRAKVAIGAGGRMVSTLDGLPDVPLSTFTLVLSGGNSGLLTSGRNLCLQPPTVDASFTAQAGLEHIASSTVATTNCATDASAPPATQPRSVKPTVTARLSKNGALTVTTKVRRGASKLRSVRVALPRGLKVDKAKRLRATRGKGASRITVKVGRKHLRVTRGRLSAKPRITVTARNAAGRTYRVKVRLR
jgi:hypothetical protein